MTLSASFARIASTVAKAAGRPVTFIVCVATVALWALSGPLFGFSDTWQLVINTATTVITFLMVFLIQNTQNRESDAIQAKLDEILTVTSAADNRFVGIEHLSDAELEAIVRYCERRAARGRKGKPNFWEEEVEKEEEEARRKTQS